MKQIVETNATDNVGRFGSPELCWHVVELYERAKNSPGYDDPYGQGMRGSKLLSRFYKYIQRRYGVNFQAWFSEAE
jgi:hypothetical protein